MYSTPFASIPDKAQTKINSEMTGTDDPDDHGFVECYMTNGKDPGDGGDCAAGDTDLDAPRPRKVSETFEDQQEEQQQRHQDDDNDDDDKTEDEEVKRNCITGVSAVKDYDFFSTDDDLTGDDDDSDFGDLNEREDEEERIVANPVDTYCDEGAKTKSIEIGVATDIELDRERLVQFVGPGELQKCATAGFLHRPMPQTPPATTISSSATTASSLSSPFRAKVKAATQEDGGSDGDDEQEDEMVEGDDDHNNDDEKPEHQDAADPQHIKCQSLPATDDHGERSFSQLFPIVVGASGSSVSDLLESSIRKKRVLSSNTLSTLNCQDGRNTDQPKRYRSSCRNTDESMTTADNTAAHLQLPLILPPLLPVDTQAQAILMVTGSSHLGDTIDQLPRLYQMRECPVKFSTNDDFCCDRILSDELNAIPTDRPFECSPDSSPIPLLTPPHSPLAVASIFNDDDDEQQDHSGDTSESTEWPSNLVIDSAMMNIRQTLLRSLSAASLQGLVCCTNVDSDKGGDDKNDCTVNCWERELDNKDNPFSSASALTPLFQSIMVGAESVKGK